MPYLDTEVDTSEPFLETELLYRRISPDELNAKGEIDPTRLEIRQFKKDVSGSPSVVRSRFAAPADAIHTDCAAGKDVSHYLVYRVTVADLPKKITAEDGKEFDAYPVHIPEPSCGAHSVIATCVAGDPNLTYAKPSRTAINDLRSKLATKLKPEPLPYGRLITVEKAIRKPSHSDIARRAYEIWESQGNGCKHPGDNWLSAERELLGSDHGCI